MFFRRIFQENFNADTIFKIEDEPILCHSYIVIGAFYLDI